MNQTKTAILQRLYQQRPSRRATALIAAKARGFGLSTDQRRVITSVAVTLGLIAAVAYIVAVNVIFLNGQAMHANDEAVKLLVRDTANVGRALAERQSPAWLETQSRSNGMISVSAVRYLTSDESLAFSR